MGRTINKIKLRFLVYIFILFVIPLGIVKADSISASASGDVVTITYSGKYTDKSLTFYYNTKKDRNSAINVLKTGMAVKYTNRAQISLKNGTYHFWVFNTLLY